MASEETANKCRKWTLLMGLIWAFLCCFQGLAIGNTTNKIMGKAAYHLLRHYSELLIGLSFAYPHATSLSDSAMKISFHLVNMAPITNFVAYMIIAITNCPNKLFENSPGYVVPGDGEGNIYTTISTLLLTVATAGTFLPGLGLLIYGVATSGNDKKRK